MHFEVYRDASERGLRKVFIDLYANVNDPHPIVRARCFRWPLRMLARVITRRKKRMVKEALVYYALKGE